MSEEKKEDWVNEGKGSEQRDEDEDEDEEEDELVKAPPICNLLRHFNFFLTRTTLSPQGL